MTKWEAWLKGSLTFALISKKENNRIKAAIKKHAKCFVNSYIWTWTIQSFITQKNLNDPLTTMNTEQKNF